MLVGSRMLIESLVYLRIVCKILRISMIIYEDLLICMRFQEPAGEFAWQL